MLAFLLVPTVLVLLTQLVICDAGFVEVPLNQTLTYPSDMAAIFRCRYEPQPDIIVWRVDGEQYRSSTQSGIESTYISHDNGSKTEILTIPNNPLYNGTQVECIAYLLAEVTPVAILIILTDTNETVNNSSFNEVPSPTLMVVTQDGLHTYMCSHSTAGRITWRVNDVVLGVDIFTISGIEYTDSISHPYDSVYTLTIRALLQNNETTIQCSAALLDGSHSQRTPVVTFLIQGQLQGVSNLERNGSTIFWEAPFTLNLTGVDPDIVYCVEVVDITCERSLLISECDVMETIISTDDALQPGYIYEYTVTPKSNVEGATNGTSVTVIEEFFTLESSGQHQLSMIDDSEIMVIFHANIHNVQASHSKIHSNSYAISLTSLDGVNDEEGIKHLANIVERNMSLVVLQVPLPFRRLWNYSMLAHGCHQHPIMKYILLSTHDVWEIFITSPSAGTIRIAGYFIPGSPATGVLVAVFNSSKVSFHLLKRKGNELHNKGILPNVRGVHHMVSVFVVEQNGLPFSRAATIPQNILVNENNNQSFAIEYNLRATSASVCIDCTFLESSTTDCVAVVHRRISQLGSRGLMNIESSHKFDRSGDTAYGCIEGVDMEQYQIGVIGGRRKQPPTSPTDTSKLAFCKASCIVGVALSSILTIVLITTLFAVIILLRIHYVRIINRRTKSRMDPPDSVNIELQKCGAYEVVKLSKQRVTMNDNPAYGEIGVGAR